MFCVWRMSTVTIFGNCLVWLMSGSGKDNRWNLTFPPWRVFVMFLHFFSFLFYFWGKISTGQITYCTLFNLPRLCLTQHKKVDKISHPSEHHLTSPFCVCMCMCVSVCVHCWWRHYQMCVQRSRTASPQCQRKSPGSSLESQRNRTELTGQQTQQLQPQTLNSDKKDAKLFTSHSDSLLYKTSSCNFMLESLWIPGTSILRYSIYRLNYESKLYQYVKILYVQLNCSMLLSALGCVYPPFAGWLCRQVLIVAMQAPVSSPVHAEASWLSRETLVWEDLFYCVLYSYLDCRRLVKHENVPSNFQAPPLYVCMYKNVTY